MYVLDRPTSDAQSIEGLEHVRMSGMSRIKGPYRPLHVEDPRVSTPPSCGIKMFEAWVPSAHIATLIRGCHDDYLQSECL